MDMLKEMGIFDMESTRLEYNDDWDDVDLYLCFRLLGVELHVSLHPFRTVEEVRAYILLQTTYDDGTLKAAKSAAPGRKKFVQKWSITLPFRAQLEYARRTGKKFEESDDDCPMLAAIVEEIGFDHLITEVSVAKQCRAAYDEGPCVIIWPQKRLEDDRDERISLILCNAELTDKEKVERLQAFFPPTPELIVDRFREILYDPRGPVAARLALESHIEKTTCFL